LLVVEGGTFIEQRALQYHGANSILTTADIRSINSFEVDKTGGKYDTSEV
jgi:hypothetical protein